MTVHTTWSVQISEEWNVFWRIWLQGSRSHHSSSSIPGCRAQCHRISALTVPIGSVTCQDINSASWLVRMYYQHRLFMGACCISCEVLYLAVRPRPRV